MTEKIMHSGLATALDIDPDRLLRNIFALGEIGLDQDTGGINRPGFGAADREARAYLIDQARRASLVPVVDPAGNILIWQSPHAVEAENRKVVMIGSHIDTVVNAGRLDGAYGVLAGLEVLQTLNEHRAEMRYEPVVVAFANEEGALFPQPFWGSMAIAGRLAELPPEPVDNEGNPLRETLRLAGGDIDTLKEAAWQRSSVAAYLELHIEQGPVLERSGSRIGVVEAITGRTVLTFQVDGDAGHAGTTPMHGRQDALVAAAHVILMAESLAGPHGWCRVATVGHVEAHPNSPNTLAGSVRMTVDLRDVDASRLINAEAELRRAIRRIMAVTGTKITEVTQTRSKAVATDPTLRTVIEHGADELDIRHEALPSGAGHDAQIMADIAPVGMIFVPSIGGVSHIPVEDTASEDLVAGARVLLRTTQRLVGLQR